MTEEFYEMKVLGIYGSPRKGGNSDLLLEEALKGAKSQDAEVSTIRPYKMDINACSECGSCDKTGICIIKDDMQQIYPLLEEAEIIFVSTPMFFYGMPSSLKALIDRCQALWSKRMLTKPKEKLRSYDSGNGYMLAVGATKGANLFEGAHLVAKYFYDALDMSYDGSVCVHKVEAKGEIVNKPEEMKAAFELGSQAVNRKKEA